MFFYYRKNGIVVMKSEEKLDCDFDYVEITPNTGEKKKIDNNWLMKVNVGKLEFEEPQHLKEENKKITAQKINNDLEKATTQTELKNIIKDLLKLYGN